ncbi:MULTISPECIES: methionine ABC transporter permease [Shouchella]|uniref:methionine ABC transporter permease n=1 Tax=Shouchella TaxID=2893057 RepID=UPI000916401A|nr:MULTISPECIES: methionine ABC transporter permease [Shouchella]MCM3311391.1 ABC transporter permease [Psychrobacillus sp. MER TA 17]MDO7285059.1 methionine ABC transporter permease [Shouchella clausii]MDO7305073.1 methionine ABC transporter permease [Shouchella clausii]PAE95901.1 ABC transporter permease [Shouchella clausii]SHL25081.1 D-methionine transport system permease protein [Shouchella rhizosphaerae]
MLESLEPYLPEIYLGIGQTFLMLGISLSAAVLLGLPLGLITFLTAKDQLLAQKAVNLVLNFVINIVRSFPFIILLVAMIPFTRAILGTTVGPLAASVPLSIAAIFFLARLVEQSLREIPKGTIEAAIAMGGHPLHIIWKVLLVEARSGLLLGLTVTAVSFISYSAIAGVVGGGGIGDLAIRYGYYRFQTDIMIITVILLVILVQSVQFLGNYLAAKIDKR